MHPKELIGKTIKSAVYKKIEQFDDEDCLHITFTDGTQAFVTASLGTYTGNSNDSLPVYLRIIDEWDSPNLVEIK